MKRRTYIIFIDILGYQQLADDISSKTNLISTYVRQFLLRDPLIRAINKFGNSIDARYFTDNVLVFAYKLERVFEIIYEVSRLTIPFNTPTLIPLEVAVAVRRFGCKF